MANESSEISFAQLARWLVIAAVVVAGIALYFWLAPTTPPVARSAIERGIGP